MSRYALHGVVVASPLALPALTAPSDALVELRLLQPEGDAPPLAPLGEVFASLDAPGARYLARRSEQGISCDFPGLGAVFFGADGHVTLGACAGDAETARALFSGSALSLWSVARCRLILHASTVAWEDCAVALIGGSGAGKTTLAAQCVIAGAELVGDDVLRVESVDDGARWYAGARWLRLRPGSSALVEAWPGAVRRAEQDDRFVLEPHAGLAATSGRLNALVWPSIDRESRDLELTRLSAAEGLRRLLLAPRVRGLSAPDLLRAQLEAAARLVRALPCFEVKTPAGPPFAAAERLHTELARHLGRQ